MAKLTSLEGPLEVNTPARQFIQRQAYNPLAGVGQAIVTVATEAGKNRAAAMKEMAAQEDAQRNKIAMGAIASSVDSTNAMLDKAMEDGVLDNAERIRILSQGRNATFRTLGNIGVEHSAIAAYMNQYDKSTFQMGTTEETQVGAHLVQRKDSMGNVSMRAATAGEAAAFIIEDLGEIDPNLANLMGRAFSGQDVVMPDGQKFTFDMAMHAYNKVNIATSDFNSLQTQVASGELQVAQVLPRAKNLLNSQADLMMLSLVEQGYTNPAKYTVDQVAARLERMMLKDVTHSDTFATFITEDGTSDSVKNTLRTEIPALAMQTAKNFMSITGGDSPLYEATRELNNAIVIARNTGDSAVLDDMREQAINRIRRAEGLEGLGAGMLAAMTGNINMHDFGIEYSRIASGQDLDSPDKLMLYRIATLNTIETLSYQEGVMEAMPTQSPLYSNAMTGFIGHLNKYITSLETGTPAMSPREIYRYTSLLLKNDRATEYLTSGDYSENGQELLGLITKVRDSSRNMISARIDPSGTAVLKINQEVEEYSRGASDKRKAAAKKDE